MSHAGWALNKGQHKSGAASAAVDASGGLGSPSDLSERDLVVTVSDTACEWLPTRADLDAATARTAAAIADPSVCLADIEHLAELEEAVHLAYLRQPGADAELQAEAEAEAPL